MIFVLSNVAAFDCFVCIDDSRKLSLLYICCDVLLKLVQWIHRKISFHWFMCLFLLFEVIFVMHDVDQSTCDNENWTRIRLTTLYLYHWSEAPWIWLLFTRPWTNFFILCFIMYSRMNQSILVKHVNSMSMNGTELCWFTLFDWVYAPMFELYMCAFNVHCKHVFYMCWHVGMMEACPKRGHSALFCCLN